jgi:hypothetical protein
MMAMVQCNATMSPARSYDSSILASAGQLLRLAS